MGVGNEETEAKRDAERQRCAETETRNRDTNRWRYLEIEADRQMRERPTGERRPHKQAWFSARLTHLRAWGCPQMSGWTDSWTDGGRSIGTPEWAHLSAYSTPTQPHPAGLWVCVWLCVYVCSRVCSWPGDGWLCWRRACTCLLARWRVCTHTVSGARLCECALSRYLRVTGLAVLLGVPGCACASVLALWRGALCSFVWPVFMNLGV